MKLSGFLLLLTILQVWAVDSYSQRTKLTLDLKNVSLEDALKTIEDQSEFFFLYSPKMVDVSRKVDIDLADKDVDFILNQMFTGTGVDYVIKDRQIVITTDEMIQPFKKETPQQERTITGVITDAETGETLPGVSVLIKGTLTGTITNMNGQYTLNVKDPSDVLVFSFVGYMTREVNVGDKSTIDLALSTQITALDEIIVVGYGTQLKGQITGSVGTVSSDQLERRSISSITQALQGQLQGLRITQYSGQPGNLNLDINIRGISTFTSNPVLTIVDGVPGELNSINPSDIESISVLKDAAVVSIYGTRASGGVILITTKRGRKGTPKLTYSGSIGVQQPARLPQKVTAYEHAINYNEAEANDSPGRTVFTFSDEDLARFSSKDWVDADMIDYMFNPAMITQHNFGISGGDDTQTYYLSLGYLNQDGIARNTSYERLNIRYNQSINLGERLTVNIKGSFSPSVRTAPAEIKYPGGKGSGIGLALRETYRYGNHMPLFTQEGNWSSVRGSYNAIALSSEEGGYQNLNSNPVTGNLSLDYSILDDLSFKFLYGINYIQSKQEDYRYILSMYNPTIPGQVDYVSNKNALRVINSRSNMQSLQMQFDYDHSFGSHDISLLGGFNQEWYLAENQSVGRSGFLTEDTRVISAGSTDRDLWTTGGIASDWALRSFIGRASYSYLNKYILETSFRIDGSSRFVSDLRWTVFPSISAAWRISDEDFLKDNNIIDFLRLRASWGQVGNQNVGFYPFAYTLSTSTYPFGGLLQQTVFTRAAANPSLTWETKATTNLGLDMNLGERLLEITLDVYKERTSDILLTVPIPSNVGLSAPPQNVGIVDNLGWELQLSHRKDIGDIRYNISFNISDATNKVVDLKGAGPFIRDQSSVTNSPGGQITEEGYALDMWYGYEADGYFQTQEEVDAHAFQNVLTSPGDIKFIDQNSDGVINADDRTRIGRSDIRYPYGIAINIGYKNFEFSALAQGVLQNYQHVYGWLANNFDRPSSTLYTYMLDHWTPDNPDARFPKHRVAQSIGINAQFSSFQLQNAAYFRMKNMQIAYNLPESLTNRIKVEGVKIYVSAENLFTITNFLGLDPEVGSIRSMVYPNARNFNMGVNINF